MCVDAGKTLAFMLPILERLAGPEKVGFRALVLSPTKELAKQVRV
jgi:ATP-dependent RNA helicase DDX52/ROK1